MTANETPDQAALDRQRLDRWIVDCLTGQQTTADEAPAAELPPQTRAPRPDPSQGVGSTPQPTGLDFAQWIQSIAPGDGSGGWVQINR